MPKKTKGAPPLFGDTEWLTRVREVRHPLDLTHPLRVSHLHITDGGALPRPSVPYPERHPFCEINFSVEGKWHQFIGMERVERSPGDMILIAPGLPHYGTILTYPNRVIVVHFLPVLLFEMGPNGDGARVLDRFTANRSISKCVVRPPRALHAKLEAYFKRMAEEFNHPRLGSELRTRACLMEALVELLRWESSAGMALSAQSATSSWAQIEKTLKFIYHHYAEPLYTEQIAREVGLSSDRLHALFHDTFGMSCIQYLRAYRISHAASLLRMPGSRVSEVASAVGFETLSNFNTSFHRVHGMSPGQYIRCQKKK